MLFSNSLKRSSLTYGRIGTLLLIVLLAAFAIYSASSLSRKHDPLKGQNTAQRAQAREAIVPRSLVFSPVFMPQGPGGESLATYDGTCTTAKTTFDLGQTVCVKTTNVPVDGSRSITWSNPASNELQRTDLTSSPNVTFVLPATQTSVVNGEVVDNRGTWTVKDVLVGRSKVRVAINFTVKDPDNPAFDLNVYSAADTTDGNVPAGTNLTVRTTVTNFGPQDAATVELLQAVPSNATFVSGGQTSIGPPTFTCVNPAGGGSGNSSCTIASLPAGTSADFTFVYAINSGAPVGTSIDSLATVTPNTTETGELHTPDNSWTARATVTENPNAPTCAVGCPANITVLATSGGGATVDFTDMIESSGACGTVTATPTSGSTFAVGTTMVNVTTDQGASCSFTVTVTNTAAPTISCAGDQSVTASGTDTEAAVTVNAPTAAGTNVTISSVRSDNRNVSDPYPVGTTTITWTATECLDSPLCEDPNARTASCVQHITVTNPNAPTISCPSDKTFAAPAGDCQRTLTAADIGTPTAGGTSVTVTSQRSDGLDLLDPYPAGQTAITWTATNSLGSVSCTQVINITTTGDSTPPVLSIPADLNVTTNTCSALLDDELGVATATDNCTPAITVHRTGVPMISCPIPGNPGRMCESFVFPVGTTNVTYSATDAAGNTATGVQHVTVHENTPPTFTFVPADLVINTGAGATSCGAFVGDATLGTATVSDNCDNTVIRTGVPAGNNFPVGDTFITYTAKADPSVSRTQKVTVVDTTPPVITLTGADPTYVECHTSYTEVGASAHDNCRGDFAATPSGTVNVNVPGNYTVTYNASDLSGNAATPVTRTVTVRDTIKPVITLTGASTVQVECHTSFTDPGATASDSCDSSVPVTVTGSVNVNVPGDYTLSYNGSDDSGNAAITVTRTVQVRDTIAPTLTLNSFAPSMWPPNHKYRTFLLTQFVTGASDSCSSTLGINDVVIEKVTSDELENSAGDGNTLNDIVIASDCKSVQLRSERDGGGNGRVYTITFRVRDASGNTTRATAKVVVAHNPGETVVDSGVHYTVTSSCP